MLVDKVKKKDKVSQRTMHCLMEWHHIAKDKEGYEDVGCMAR